MKVIFAAMTQSENIDFPDDENNFYRQLAKKDGIYAAAMQC